MSDKDPTTGRFLPGNSGFGGRKPGSKNKFQTQFWDDLATLWENEGANALKKVLETDTSTFVRVAAGLLPKEEEHTNKHIIGIRLWTQDEWLAYLTSQEVISKPSTKEPNDTRLLSATGARVKH